MAMNSGLSCRWRFTAMLLMLLLPLMIQFLFIHGARLSIEERQPQRTPQVNDKSNNYTVSSSSSSSQARSEFDYSDRLVPTGPNPLHHRHH